MDTTTRLMTVIPQIETVIVNMMNTDEPGHRISADQWDRLLGMVMAARTSVSEPTLICGLQ